MSVVFVLVFKILSEMLKGFTGSCRFFKRVCPFCFFQSKGRGHDGEEGSNRRFAYEVFNEVCI